MAMATERAGFVRFQQQLAREALDRGETRAARAALLVVRSEDFAEGADLAASCLATLRDRDASIDQIADAIRTLIELRPGTA